MNENAIVVKNLNKTFYIHDDRKSTLRALFTSFFSQGKTREFKALNNINFEIKRGEFVGIVGRNGSGKSTLLKILAGIYNSDKGSEVKINGTMVPFLELGVGFNPDLSGRENIFLNGTILGMTRVFLEKKFDEIVDFAELRSFIDVPVKNYSSGMMVRLAFSIAIQSNADVYLLDEILAVGDENFQKKSASVIRRLKSEGKTILFISHSMESIKAYCDRALLIDRYELKMDGNPYLVTEEYRRLNEVAIPQTKNETEKDRWGNKDVEITNIEIKDDKGNVVNEFKEAGNINIEIAYQVNKPDHNELVFGIGIYRQDGLHITGTNTGNNNITIVPKEKGLIKFKLSNKYLLDNDYAITVSVLDPLIKETLDYHSNRYQFRIRLNNKDQGAVSLPVEWEVLS